jgi:cell division protein FtsQ
MSDRGARRWRLVRARSDAIPASVRRFNQRARQRRRQAARPWLVGAVALLLGALVWGVAYHTSLLGVSTIEVRGNTLVTTDQVRAAAAVPDGTPLVSLDLTEVQRRVASLTPVSHAVVTRDWPSTLVIVVTERTPVAMIARTDKRYDLIDGSGVVYRTEVSRPAGLPLVKLGRPGPQDPSTRAALLVLAALTGELRGQLVALVVDTPTRIRLDLANNRQIIWGDATDNATKARAATSLLPRQGSVIDVSAPSFVIVR